MVAAVSASLFFGSMVLATHSAENFSDLFYFGNILANLGQFFTHPKIIILPILAILLFMGISIYSNQLILKKAKIPVEKNRFLGLQLFLKAAPPVILMYLLIRIGENYTPFFIFITFPCYSIMALGNAKRGCLVC